MGRPTVAKLPMPVYGTPDVPRELEDDNAARQDWVAGRTNRKVAGPASAHPPRDRQGRITYVPCQMCFTRTPLPAACACASGLHHYCTACRVIGQYARSCQGSISCCQQALPEVDLKTRTRWGFAPPADHPRLDQLWTLMKMDVYREVAARGGGGTPSVPVIGKHLSRNGYWVVAALHSLSLGVFDNAAQIAVQAFFQVCYAHCEDNGRFLDPLAWLPLLLRATVGDECLPDDDHPSWETDGKWLEAIALGKEVLECFTPESQRISVRDINSRSTREILDLILIAAGPLVRAASAQQWAPREFGRLRGLLESVCAWAEGQGVVVTIEDIIAAGNRNIPMNAARVPEVIDIPMLGEVDPPLPDLDRDSSAAQSDEDNSSISELSSGTLSSLGTGQHGGDRAPPPERGEDGGDPTASNPPLDDEDSNAAVTVVNPLHADTAVTDAPRLAINRPPVGEGLSTRVAQFFNVAWGASNTVSYADDTKDLKPREHFQQGEQPLRFDPKTGEPIMGYSAADRDASLEVGDMTVYYRQVFIAPWRLYAIMTLAAGVVASICYELHVALYFWTFLSGGCAFALDYALFDCMVYKLIRSLWWYSVQGCARVFDGRPSGTRDTLQIVNPILASTRLGVPTDLQGVDYDLIARYDYTHYGARKISLKIYRTIMLKRAGGLDAKTTQANITAQVFGLAGSHILADHQILHDTAHAVYQSMLVMRSSEELVSSGKSSGTLVRRVFGQD